MRHQLVILFIVCSCRVFAKTPAASELRGLYYKAYGNRENAQKFYDLMEANKNDNCPIAVCYRAMSNMLLSDISYNPCSKLSYFNRGRELLENAARADPGNIEIIFLRFCIQTNVPWILHYNKDLSADKITLLRRWNEITDEDLKRKIKDYMLHCSYCSKIEKSLFI